VPNCFCGSGPARGAAQGTGDGLGYLADLAREVSGSLPERSGSVARVSFRGSEWLLIDFQPAPGYVAAVAVERIPAVRG